MDDKQGIKLFFHTEVMITKSFWKMDALTFISKVGGLIGISKNLLWLILIFLSSVGILLTRLDK